MSTDIANKVLTELKQFTYETCKQTPAPERVADLCANAAIKVITLNFKNRLMYIPLGRNIKRTREHNIIRNEFNGNNHAELAIKYKRSQQNIYMIIKSKKGLKYKKPILIKVIEDYMPVEFIRLGLPQDQAEAVAQKIADYLQKTFPGVSIYASISE